MSRKNTSQRRRARLRLQLPATVRFRFGTVLLCAVLVGGAASGCGAPAPELDGDAAKALQSRVLAVTEAAAADDLNGSLQQLDELGTELDQAAAAGDVSFQRHQDIRVAIDTVRADLTALQAEAARVAAEQAAAAEAARVAAEQAAAAEAAAAASAAPPPPVKVAPVPAPADNSKDNGKGNGKDSGKGNGKGKGND